MKHFGSNIFQFTTFYKCPKVSFHEEMKFKKEIRIKFYVITLEVR